MNKTLYIRDEDLPLWDRARELAGEKLSPVIVESLKRFVAEEEAKPKGFERIVLEFDDSEDKGLPKRKAFIGRWILGPNDRIEGGKDEEEAFSVYQIAETAKGKVVVFVHREQEISEGTAGWGYEFHVFQSFDSAAEEFPWQINRALKKRGIPIEELDI